MSQCECTAQWQRINELARTTRRRHDDDAKTSISCETSSTFHTLKVRIVSQCECTAQWQRINELARTTRRRHDDDTRKTTRTQVQPQTPTINGNPSLRIREKASNERLARSLLQISKKKHPKRAFRARRPAIFTGKASKMIVSCEASSKFTKECCKRGGFLQISQNNASKTQSFTSPGQCAGQFQGLKIWISSQFRAIDPPNQNGNVRLAATARHPKFQNACFATAACAKMYESRIQRTTFAATRGIQKSTCYHSFGRPTSTK